MNNKKTLSVRGRDYTVSVGCYVEAKLAMGIILTGEEGDELIPTVSLGNYYTGDPFKGECDPAYASFVQLNTAFMDINDIPEDILSEIIDQLGGEPYTRYGEKVTLQSGYVRFPLYQFSGETLKEYDPEGYVRYKKAWQGEVPVQQAALKALLGL